jgi:flavodoxin
MPNILVAYYSLTGNTRMIAEAIYEALPQSKTIKPISEVRSVAKYDLLFIGFPVQSHSVPYKAERFLESLPPGKKTALFSTHGAVPGSILSREAIEHAAVVASHAKLISTFSCQGKVSPQALEILSRSPEHEAWVEMGASASSHPNENDLAEAKAFARRVLALSEEPA